ncbi:unnamed protein product [Medioppia subpectinata]|uniref:Uncharacterized protein n=1 Tax=Medioppia subpectinata TaxID=1979941 RepID=A0A7R9KJI5_9ACAR|nr:unnamed protein product [Medioppia subpectinata]CAG2104697.1 unnamed protein product [Medioppia subpectinata]
MFAYILSFLLIGTFVSVESARFGFTDPGNANKLIDQLLGVVKTKYGANLDPFHVPDQHLHFDKKVALTWWHGQLNISEGLIKGLSHLIRSGDCDIGTDKGKFVAHVQVGDANVAAHFHGVMKLNIFHATVNLDVSIGNLDVKLGVGLDDKQKMHLNDFNIDELKNVKIHVSGLKIFTPLVNALANAFVNVFNPQTRQILGNLLKGIIEKEIQNIKIPPTAIAEY